MMPSSSASSISSSAAGISSRLSRQTRLHFLRAQAQRGERNVHHFARGHCASFSARARVLDAAGMLAQHLAGGGARHVHGHVAAADDDHFLADGEPVAEIHVEQEIDALVNAVEIDAGNA